MKRAPMVVVLAVLFLGVTAGSARASKPVTVTFHEKNATESFHDVIPCLEGGAGATITTTENGVFHVTAAGIDDQGTPDPEDDVFIPPYHITGTFTGTVVAVPDDPSLPTYTGHFTTWFGENSNAKSFVDTDTFTVIAHGSDGSIIKFHDTFHVTVNAQGQVTVEFDKPHCF